MEHVRLVDGLRGVGAALVLVSHVAFWTGASQLDVVGGWLARGDSGVALFFAISAFLLLSPAIIHGLDTQQRSSANWRGYAYRRFARIFPAYWCALAAVLVVAYFAQTPDGVGGLRKVLIHVFLGQALFVEQYQGFSQTWSLTTELTFYFAVPLFSWFIVRTLKRDRRSGFDRLLATLVLIAAAGITCQAGALLLTVNGYVTAGAALATSALGHAAWFAAGAVLALLFHSQRFGLTEKSESQVLRIFTAITNQSRATIFLCALAVYAIAATELAGPRDLSVPTVGEVMFKESAYTMLAFLLLLIAIKPIQPGSPLEGFAASGLNAWIGNTSYGVFLWHLVVLQVVFLLNGSTLFNAHFGWTLQLVVTLTALVATASWYLLEQPILRFVRQRTTTGRERVLR